MNNLQLWQAVGAVLGGFAALISGLYLIVTRSLLKRMGAFKSDTNQIKSDLRSGLDSLRTDMNRDMNSLRTDMNRGFERIDQRLERIESKLDNHGERITRLEERAPFIHR